MVCAHPDDEVLGCGGTMAALATAGWEVLIATFGEGLASRYDHADSVNREAVHALQACSARAAALLGAHRVPCPVLPDNRFDKIPLLDIVKHVENVMGATRPDVVYTHHGGDLNKDHEILFRAVLTATRPTSADVVPDVYAFEVASSTEWAFQSLGCPFHANVFVDIAATIERKLEAMALYESESRTFPHPRSPEALEAAARRWGSVAGCPAAEAFELIRSIRRPCGGGPR